MLRILKFLFTGRWGGCEHVWQVEESFKKVRQGSNIPHAVVYTLQCKKCGDLKTKIVN